MGIYLNPGDDRFRMDRRSEIYVDKSGLIACLNRVCKSAERFVCVSRPRRFGKSMAANMIAAYYDHHTTAQSVFEQMKIAQYDSFSEHMGKYDVVQINMQDFLSRAKDADTLVAMLQKRLVYDLLQAYPDFPYFDANDLIEVMNDVHAQTKRPFVIIIDEWDCIFREYRDRKDWQEKYLDFLRAWLKDKAYVGLAYMTGILPIKKYGTHSALNMFREFSMTDAGPLAEYTGFTDQEVKELCETYHMNYDECKAWYDGYHFNEVGSIYSPRSIVQSMLSHKFSTYWNQTENFEALKVYMDMNYDGLREAIIALMAGERRRIDTASFTNDMTTFHTMDDVLTLLVHLGYLGYDFDSSSVFIPNQEILREYASAVKAGGWDTVAKAIKASDQLLEDTLALKAEAVAQGIEEAHMETSHLTYNDENALAYTLSLAYYTARQKYTLIREFPAGKGFADLAFLPKPNHAGLPALLLELKWDKGADTAIRQIKEKAYPKAFEAYAGKVLLVDVSYDKKSRAHECLIEKAEVCYANRSASVMPKK